MIPKPKYLLAYLNAVSGRTAKELCDDIISEGFSSSLMTIIALLKDKDINVEYLCHMEFEWKTKILYFSLKSDYIIYSSIHKKDSPWHQT